MPNNDNYTINNNISKATLSYVSNNDTKYIYPKTSGDNIVIQNGNNTTLLSNKLNSIKSRIEELPSTLSSSGGDNLLSKIIDRTIASITIPSSVTFIDNYAFQSCTALTSVTFENNSQLTSIGDYAFSYCSALTSITIPSSITSISYGTFQSCTSLTSINIPSSVTSIGSSAFTSCANLEFVTLGNGFNANNLSLSASTKYSVETMVSWFNALYDRTGLSAYKLTIGSTNLNKLTAEQKAIATNKNWTLA